MIGNDIVDLEESRRESRWQRRGWTDKLFTRPEQAIISGAAVPEVMAWLLWSMKEAAYKIVNRRQRTMFYAPARFHCVLAGFTGQEASGTVTFEDSSYATASLLSGHFIHTVATAQHTGSRYTTLLRHTSRPLVLPAHLTFGKDADGIPFLADRKRNLVLDASLSHHGRYSSLVVLNEAYPVIDDSHPTFLPFCCW